MEHGVTPANKKYLRGLCHHIKPVVMVAGKGLTDSILTEIDNALLQHELIKVKLRVPAPQRKAYCVQILDASSAEKIHAVGQVLCLYRHNQDDPKISFP